MPALISAVCIEMCIADEKSITTPHFYVFWWHGLSTIESAYPKSVKYAYLREEKYNIRDKASLTKIVDPRCKTFLSRGSVSGPCDYNSHHCRSH